MNHSILIGRLGKDPEERVTKNGKKGIFFSLAVDSYFSKEKKTDWYSIQVWDENLFRLCLSLKKGSLVSVAGTPLPVKTYEAKDGTTRVDQGLNCSAIYFVPSISRPEGSIPNPLDPSKTVSREELADHLDLGF